MKRLFLLILFFIISFSCVSAQEKLFNYSPDDPEKIYLFDVNIFVEENGDIKVAETLFLNVKNQKINHGLIRNIPVSEKEKLHNISLFMDGAEHPFFTKKSGSDLEIYFGDDNYISTGLHTYSLTYKYPNAINFLPNYNELYWNVTGDGWGFPIDKAKVKVTFLENTHVMEKGISLYTGRYREKEHNAKQIDTLTFETTSPLNPGEGFTIAIPFHKGTIEPVGKPFAYSSSDPEKIYLFDVNIIVEKNGEIQVTENITLNAKHQEINRGITRNIPVSAKEKLHNISLTMDGVKHPFFTEKAGPDLEINFGDDNYISTGLHTYRLTYKFMGAINFNKDYDELYWDVTGNEWLFPIDKAKVKVIFPENTNIMENGISLYTGRYREKEHNAKQIDTLTFETTAPLSTGEGFTIAIPFHKGIIKQPSLIKRLLSIRFFISLILFIVLIIYCVKTWWQVGRDPFYTVVPQYEPPKNISPAFICYEKKRRDFSKVLACAILDLVTKRYIKIEEKDCDVILYKQKDNYADLPQEEIFLLTNLFKSSNTCILDKKVGKILEEAKEIYYNAFYKRLNSYYVRNTNYIGKAILLVIALAIMPLLGNDLLFSNLILVFIFLILSSFDCYKLYSKIIFFSALSILFLSLYSLCPEIKQSYPLDIFICEVFFGIGAFLMALYSHFIPNITPEGKEFYEYLKGFKKYIKTAEWQRAQASNPIDAERIFCDYLPYAYAMGLYNQWVKKFTGILSAVTISEDIELLESEYLLSNRLAEKISSSMPVHHSHSSSTSSSYSSSSRSSGSGSFGSGYSGGGHGGGGGRGR